MREQASQALGQLRQQNGLYLASPSDTYHYVWIRDNCYMALADLESARRYEQTYHALLDIFRKYEWKLAYHALHKPVEAYEYIHPRYTADTLDEVWAPWGNAQNDAIGLFLFGVGEGLKRGYKLIRDDADRRVVARLIQYLQTLEYWQDEDNGMWEEVRERHSSSIGACVAGLLAVAPYVPVDDALIRNGLHALYDLLPRESPSKSCDLAQLSLIYPYRLLPHALAESVVANVERNLLRDYGVIRYVGDQYYADDGREAEWCMGLPWLGLCHHALGHAEQACYYLERSERVMPEAGVVPELYLAKQMRPNENTPLGWAAALTIVLYDSIREVVRTGSGSSTVYE